MIKVSFFYFVFLDNASTVFNVLKTVALCPGNVDFPMVIKNKLQDLPEDGYHFKDKYEKPKAGIQTDKLDTFSDFSTIRAKDCELVIDGRTTVKCPNCKA